MVSVLIPTANRPDMLRTALKSIAGQTALGEIDEVIVSENGGDSRSREVCAEFPGFPLTYIFRDKPLTPIEHAYALFHHPLKGACTAMLHDDDWWAPQHLETALRALQAHPEAAVYHGSYFVVSSESSPLFCYNNLAFWFGAGYPAVDSLWLLDRPSVLLGSLLGTGGVYSSLVARTPACAEAARIYQEGNPLDNDRMLTFALTQFGPLLYQPVPLVYYRQHGGQDTYNFIDHQRNNQMAWTTRWLIKESGRDAASWGDIFAERVAHCPVRWRSLLDEQINRPWCLPVLAQDAPGNSRVAQLFQSAQSLHWKNFFKQLLPPLLISKLRRIGSAE